MMQSLRARVSGDSHQCIRQRANEHIQVEGVDRNDQKCLISIEEVRVILWTNAPTALLMEMNRWTVT
jgi:hypothetical protein